MKNANFLKEIFLEMIPGYIKCKRQIRQNGYTRTCSVQGSTSNYQQCRHYKKLIQAQTYHRKQKLPEKILPHATKLIQHRTTKFPQFITLYKSSQY